jgi:FkbM family methyltransferase
VRSIYERLIYDPRTQTVTVVRGPMKGSKKYGPFRESDFDFALGQYEREIMDALCRFCRPGMIVFDIGASAGYLTLLMAKLVGDSGQVHAFEPIPENYQCLLETLRINGCRNVKVHQVAISKQGGKARMNYIGLFDGFATLAEGGHNYYLGQSADTVFVATINLDRFCTDMGIAEIGLVKMDIEGAEMLALEGMSEILTVQRPVLIIEFWGAKNISGGMRLLSSKGYNIKVLSVWNGFVRGVKTDIQNILASPV